MPSKSYAWVKDGEKELHVEWKPMWKMTTFRVGGHELGVVDGAANLRRGVSFDLPDGAGVLRAQLGARGLELARDGEPLPGTPADPTTAVQMAGDVTMATGAVASVIGGCSMAFGWAWVPAEGAPAVFSVGILLLAMAFGIRFGSVLAMLVAFTVVSFYVSTAVVTYAVQGQGSLAFIFVLGLVSLQLWRGVRAMFSLKRAEKNRDGG